MTAGFATHCLSEKPFQIKQLQQQLELRHDMHVATGVKDLVVDLCGHDDDDWVILRGENLGHGGGDQQRLVLDGHKFCTFSTL